MAWHPDTFPFLPPVYLVWREGNVFTSVCVSVCPQGWGEGVPQQGPGQGIPQPGPEQGTPPPNHNPIPCQAQDSYPHTTPPSLHNQDQDRVPPTPTWAGNATDRIWRGR